MRLLRFVLIMLAASMLCMGGGASWAQQANQSNAEKPAAQTEEAAKQKAAEQDKKQDESKQPQPANVPIIKKDEGC
jgi:uncharacterized protein HemX